MRPDEKMLWQLARRLGFRAGGDQLYSLRDWLRDDHQIHVEVGSIWDELNNKVESYSYTISAPINVYYFEPICCGGGMRHYDTLLEGIYKALLVLEGYNQQKHLKPADDELVVVYLKGYGDKRKPAGKPPVFKTNIENFAYLLGKQGDYIEEGLTDDDIVNLVRNQAPAAEQLRLE